jgi:hypothetical protein
VISRNRVKLSLTFILISCLIGCGGGGGDSAPLPKPAPIINSLLKPMDLNLDCRTNLSTSVILVDPKINPEYGYENNSWGSWGLYDRPAPSTPWSQCIGMGFAGMNNVVARWVWDFGDNISSGVRSYPEIVYGYKPTGNVDNSPSLPKVINSITSIDINWNIEIDRGNGSGWVLLESWLSNTSKPYSLKSGDVNLELGIVIDCWVANGWCNPTGEIVNIGKNLYIYNINSSPNPGNPNMVSFHSIKTLSGQNNIDLKLFLNFLKERNVISDIHYINDIEFGTEIINGKGEVRLNSYSVTVK